MIHAVNYDRSRRNLNDAEVQRLATREHRLSFPMLLSSLTRIISDTPLRGSSKQSRPWTVALALESNFFGLFIVFLPYILRQEKIIRLPRFFKNELFVGIGQQRILLQHQGDPFTSHKRTL